MCTTRPHARGCLMASSLSVTLEGSEARPRVADGVSTTVLPQKGHQYGGQIGAPDKEKKACRAGITHAGSGSTNFRLALSGHRTSLPAALKGVLSRQ